MRRTQLSKPLRDLLVRIPYACVATVCEDGRPWNSPLFVRWDDNLNLHWISHKGAHHSRNIARDPRIFVVVYDSTVPEGEGLGIYMTMHARLLKTSEEITQAKAVYDTSFFTHDFANHDQFIAPECPQGFYQASPEKIWCNTDSQRDNHFVDTRQKIPWEA